MKYLNYKTITLIILLLIGTIVYFSVSKISTESKGEIKIATGTKNGMYYHYALEYQKRLKKNNVNLVLVPTTGSNQAQKLLNDGKVDIAFLQGGSIDKNQSNNLESLASIYFEPLWIFVNNNQKNITKISDFKNKRIATGLKGSGTEELTKKLLAANGITEKNSKFISMNTIDAKNALKKNEIDFLFTVISPDSKLINELLLEKEIRLLPIKRTKAYEIKFPFLTHFTMPEGSFNLLKNIPAKDTNLISTVATLAINKSFPPELIRLIMREVVNVHKEEKLFSDNQIFPSEKYLELPINEAAKKYLEKGENWLEDIFPYWIAYFIDHFKLLLIPLLTLLLPLFKGFMPFYRWRVRKRIYHWYRDLIEVENIIAENPSKLEENKDRIRTLIDEISNQTTVPLSYAGELYELKLHMEFVLRKLNDLSESE